MVTLLGSSERFFCQQVERVHFMETRQSAHGRRHASSGGAHMSQRQRPVPGAGAKRKVPLGRLVFGDAKRLKWLDEQLSKVMSTATQQPADCTSQPPACSTAQRIEAPAANAAAASPSQGTADAAHVLLPGMLPMGTPGSTQKQGHQSLCGGAALLPGSCSSVAAAACHSPNGGDAASDTVLLRELLALGSAEEVRARLAAQPAPVQQRLRRALQELLQRLPSCPARLDAHGDGYAPPPPRQQPHPQSAQPASALAAACPSHDSASVQPATLSAATPAPAVAIQPLQAHQAIQQRPQSCLAASAAAAAARFAALQASGPRPFSAAAAMPSGAVCGVCERPIPGSAVDGCWACAGSCHQQFHSACQSPAAAGLCSECSSPRCASSSCCHQLFPQSFSVLMAVVPA
jgi:hypothetical protein